MPKGRGAHCCFAGTESWSQQYCLWLRCPFSFAFPCLACGPGSICKSVKKLRWPNAMTCLRRLVFLFFLLKIWMNSCLKSQSLSSFPPLCYVRVAVCSIPARNKFLVLKQLERLHLNLSDEVWGQVSEIEPDSNEAQGEAEAESDKCKAKARSIALNALSSYRTDSATPPISLSPASKKTFAEASCQLALYFHIFTSHWAKVFARDSKRQLSVSHWYQVCTFPLSCDLR